MKSFVLPMPAWLPRAWVAVARCARCAFVTCLAMATAATIVTTPARAEPIQDAAGTCAVQGSHYLKKEYVLRYTGGCKAGLAHGEGEASWLLRNYENTRYTWKGRFNEGVYQPAPASQAVGRIVGRDKVAFDVGDVPAASGLRGARLHALASHGQTDPADACRPDSLVVTLPNGDGIDQEEAAQGLMRAAMAKLLASCGGKLKEEGRSSRVGHRVDVQVLPALGVDGNGNVLDVSANAWVPANASEPLQSYSNRVASKLREEKAQAENKAAREATLAKLRAAFDKDGAKAWVWLPELAQNPFR